jgi:hypothetical protein
VSQQKIRASSRRVKLFRDQLVDNAIIIDDSQDDFFHILNLIFDNARDIKDANPDTLDIDNSDTATDNQKKDTQDPKNPQNKNGKDQAPTFETATSVSLKKEYRKLYREIIKKVHPDRYDILGITTEYQVKRSKKLFLNAKTCAESNNEQGIVELCAQLEVDLENTNLKNIEDHLVDSEAQITERIKLQEKSLQMMWYHSKDNLKNKVLIVKAYIEQLGKRGKNITDTLIKDVVTSYNLDGTRKKRKVGQRPAKLKR